MKIEQTGYMSGTDVVLQAETVLHNPSAVPSTMISCRPVLALGALLYSNTVWVYQQDNQHRWYPTIEATEQHYCS